VWHPAQLVRAGDPRLLATTGGGRVVTWRYPEPRRRESARIITPFRVRDDHERRRRVRRLLGAYPRNAKPPIVSVSFLTDSTIRGVLPRPGTSSLTPQQDSTGQASTDRALLRLLRSVRNDRRAHETLSAGRFPRSCRPLAHRRRNRPICGGARIGLDAMNRPAAG